MSTKQLTSLKLRMFSSPQEVIDYIQSEIAATLEQDLLNMEGSERSHYTSADRREMKNRISDVNAVIAAHAWTAAGGSK